MAMRVVISDKDSIVGWLYPGAFPEIPDPPNDSVATPNLSDADFNALWDAASADYGGRDATTWTSSGCDVGVPHDAPDHVTRILPELLAILAAIPDHERWRIAEPWATKRLNKRPNNDEVALHKRLVRDLCNLARQAIAVEQMVVLIPDSCVVR